MSPGLPQWLSSGSESACNAGNMGLIPRLGRSPGRVHGNPLQYSCQENLMDRGAWHAMVLRVAKSRTQLKQLGLQAFILPSAIPKTTKAKVYRASEILKGTHD